MDEEGESKANDVSLLAEENAEMEQLVSYIDEVGRWVGKGIFSSRG